MPFLYTVVGVGLESRQIEVYVQQTRNPSAVEFTAIRIEVNRTVLREFSGDLSCYDLKATLSEALSSKPSVISEKH